MSKLTLDWVYKMGRLDVTKEDVKEYNKKVVNYTVLEDYEAEKRSKIDEIVNYCKEHYNPEKIWLACSQVNGFVLDETSNLEDIELKKKVLGRDKISDWDIIIEGVKETVRISPFIVIDIYPKHWNNVKKILIYDSVE